jgi:predicted nucleotidyltransferase
MQSSKLRRQIAHEAARLMYAREESEYYRAKLKTSRRFCQGWVKPADLPSNAEIREEIQTFARLFEGEERQDRLCDVRCEALSLMRLLRRFRPRLIGSVLTGHIRAGSDIDIHVFSDQMEPIVAILDDEGLDHTLERKLVTKQGVETVYRHIHVQDRFEFEITVYPADQAHYVFKSSITGKAIERASIRELEKLLQQAYPALNLEEALTDAAEQIDRFRVYESLLLPMENVKQNPVWHPEGDALFHSLQVFELARRELAYDEEFLLAALLHDIGKGIDSSDHVSAGLEALQGFITERTAWLIAHHMEAQQILAGSLGQRAKRRLQQNESYEELLLLARCDRDGRVPGGAAPELTVALQYIRELGKMFG